MILTTYLNVVRKYSFINYAILLSVFIQIYTFIDQSHDGNLLP